MHDKIYFLRINGRRIGADRDKTAHKKRSNSALRLQAAGSNPVKKSSVLRKMYIYYVTIIADGCQRIGSGPVSVAEFGNIAVTCFISEKMIGLP